MVEEIVVATVLHAAAVDGEAVVGLSHDLALIGPRSGDLVGCGVGPVLGHTAGGIFEVVLAVALVWPRGFLEVGVAIVVLMRSEGFLVLHVDRHFTAREGCHVLVQPDVPEVVVAIEEVSLPVVVDDDGGINLEPSLYKWLFNRILIRSGGVVGHGDANAGISLSLDGGGDIPVPLAVALNTLAGPAVVALLGPGGERGGGQRCAAIGPVHHVDSAIEQPVLHGEVVVHGLVLVVVYEEIECVTMHVWRRVGRIAVADNGVLRMEIPTPRASRT